MSRLSPEHDSRPFSQACVNNRTPILSVLQRVFAKKEQVLEIGSGTGQHAVYFGEHLPHLTWQTSDLPENHAGILAWLAAYPQANVLPPVALDVAQIPAGLQADAIFSANTLHIMPYARVCDSFRQRS